MSLYDWTQNAFLGKRIFLGHLRRCMIKGVNALLVFISLILSIFACGFSKLSSGSLTRASELAYSISIRLRDGQMVRV